MGPQVCTFGTLSGFSSIALSKREIVRQVFKAFDSFHGTGGSRIHFYPLPCFICDATHISKHPFSISIFQALLQA